MKKLILTIACLWASTCVQAANVYQLTGIAQSFRPDTDETHEIDQPTIPHYGSTLSIDGNEVTLHYGGGDGTCVAHIEKRNPYVFDDGPISIIRGNTSEAKVAEFYHRNFNVDIKSWTFEYYVGVPVQYAKRFPSSPCTAFLDGAVLYGSDKSLSIVDGHSFVYVLKRVTSGPLPLVREAGVDCRLAQGGAEQLVCTHRELAALDGEMSNLFDNLYSVRADVKPARNWIKDQTGWLRDVRDKCDTVDCLKQAYTKRNAYLNSKLPDLPN